MMLADSLRRRCKIVYCNGDMLHRRPTVLVITVHARAVREAEGRDVGGVLCGGG